jgi:hypothetical protein
MPSKKDLSQAVEAFRKAFPPDESYRSFKAIDAKRLGERLPPALRLLAEGDGWASYADQSLWLCDPDEWNGVASPWMEEGAETADVVMRSGFGDLVVWDGAVFWLVMPHESARMRYALRDDFLLRYSLPKPETYFQLELPERMARGRKEAGPLKHDTIYTFVPALALGGDEKKSKVETAKAREGLSILAQLAPVETMGLRAE